MKAQNRRQTQKKYRKSQPVPGSEMIGSTKFRKSENENKTAGNWGEEGRRTSPFPAIALFSHIKRLHFRVPFTNAESLEQAKKSQSGTE